MAMQRRLPTGFQTPELRQTPIGPGESFLMHRYPAEDHIDDDTCWCGPLRWSYEQTRKMPLRHMQERMDQFLCVH